MESWTSDALNRLLERHERRIRKRLGSGRRTAEFVERAKAHGPALLASYHRLYGWRWDFAFVADRLMLELIDAAAHRRRSLRRRDRSDVDPLSSPDAVWAMSYVDRFSGTSDGLSDTIGHLQSLGVTHLHLMPPYETPMPRHDGGYAVQSYRRLRPQLGSIESLEAAIDRFAESGIAVVLDFVANHTASTHRWAEAAKVGDPRYRDFYFIFPDRTEPDQYASTLRPIFPDRPGDAFTWTDQIDDGAWVWTTFYEFQWDLDYSNPAVTTAMIGELAHVANLGVGVVRADAIPFLWKAKGTPSENLDEAHVVVEIFARVLDIVAPSVTLLSEAIVHPDEIVRFITPDEAELGYNAMTMSLGWEALATRDTRMLRLGISRRLELPDGCQWITYLRCHDDIGWGFADEDAETLGIDPTDHRRFLNEFYSSEFPGSFATGLKFQEDPVSGDARICGTLASLAGLEQALESADPDMIDLAVARILMLHAFMLTVVGIPLLYLGDELGQLNDHSFGNDPNLTHDNRWAHRPHFSWETLRFSEDGTGPSGRILSGVRQLLAIRKHVSALGTQTPLPCLVETPTVEVLAFTRTEGDEDFMGIFNFSERQLNISMSLDGWQAISRRAIDPLSVGPYGYGWFVRSRPRSTARVDDGAGSPMSANP